MRITSGILRGRTFHVPKNGMRPTKEQVREAVFSSLVSRIPEARVLDLFAGAGSYALEAWSRGAESVTAVEKVSAHYGVLQRNFQALAGDPNLGTWQAVRTDVFDFLRHRNESFNLIFSDPPYDQADLPKLLSSLKGALVPEGLLVFEMRSSDTYSVSTGWNLIKEKVYGETRILFLEQEQ